MFVATGSIVHAEESAVRTRISSVSKVEGVKPLSIDSPTAFNGTLSRGAKNSEVLALQKKLKELGFYDRALDSDYGSGTLAAVKQFQNKHGLKPDGIAGPKTFAKILGSNEFTLPPVEVENKPSFCTDEYKPVCGLGDGKKKTFANRCLLSASEYDYKYAGCLLYTSPSPRDKRQSRMPSSA